MNKRITSAQPTKWRLEQSATLKTDLSTFLKLKRITVVSRWCGSLHFIFCATFEGHRKKENKKTTLFKPARDVIFLTHRATAQFVWILSGQGLTLCKKNTKSTFSWCLRNKMFPTCFFLLCLVSFFRKCSEKNTFRKTALCDVTEGPATSLVPPQVHGLFPFQSRWNM